MTPDLLAEVPLPGLPAEAPLWAVLIHGPEKVVAQASRWAADNEAVGIKQWLNAVRRQGNYDAKFAAGLITWTSAEVIAWPGLRSTHAEELAQRLAEENE